MSAYSRWREATVRLNNLEAANDGLQDAILNLRLAGEDEKALEQEVKAEAAQYDKVLAGLPR